MSDTVRVFIDLKSGKFSSVAAADVPAGYIRVVRQGIGEGFIDPSVLRESDDGQPIHPPFVPELRAEVARIHSVLSIAMRMDLPSFEEGFRADKHPWREIALWDQMADLFEKVCGTPRMRGITGTPRDILALILSFVNNGPSTASRPVRAYRSVSEPSARKLHDLWFAERRLSAVALAATKYRGMFGSESLPELPSTVSIHTLFDETDAGPNLDADFNIHEFIETADVILGVDVESGHEFVVYGSGGDPDGRRVVRVELDQDTDELERLCALVEVRRGRHDYRAT
jgi:hypothetical protein